jgi:hypothetical protein
LHHCCRMKPVLVLPKHNYLCSIMPASSWFLVSTCFSLGNLAHNATRLSLSNEPFLLNKVICFPVFMMYLHFCCHFMQITH